VTHQFSESLRNARADTYESHIGASPTLEIRTGAPPANCAAADSGTLLATVAMPADWMAAASAGAKAKSGTWSDTADAAGTAAHFRIKASGGTVHHQGTVTATGGGGDMTVDNAVFAVGQAFSITTFGFTEGGA
jgi:hypothetical protein